MTTDHDVTTVRLPHSGLRVPDRSLSLTGYKQLTTSCGVAFTANLRVNNRPVGMVENEGRGGMTMFRSKDWRTFSDKHLDDYAANCRTEDGEPVDTEMLLDTLVDEHDWTRKVAAAARKDRVKLRVMRFGNDGFPPYSYAETDGRRPANEQQWQLLAQQATRLQAGPGDWWQGWTGTGWRDLTARPRGVDPALYG